MKIKLHRMALACCTLVLSHAALTAQAIETPRSASPAAAVEQTIGISTVRVEYSRPSVKGREIWGKLVPYGWNKEVYGNGNLSPWRAGANENTVIEFSDDAKVEGKSVPAGRYGLFFTINADNTGEVILSKDSHSWGNYFYEPGNDQVRAPIKLRDHEMTELLTYRFINMSDQSAELVLEWEKKQFPVRIEFDVNDIVLMNAADHLKGTAGFSWEGFHSAAAYSLLFQTDMEQGLKWADQAVSMNRNFKTLKTQAGLLHQLGHADKAMMVEKEALTMGSEEELNAYGYELVQQQKFVEAIAIFKLNTERHPNSANAWDSLGEGYALSGDKKNAIASFRKALTLNPAENVKANSTKYLKQLGEM